MFVYIDTETKQDAKLSILPVVDPAAPPPKLKPPKEGLAAVLAPAWPRPVPNPKEEPPVPRPVDPVPNPLGFILNKEPPEVPAGKWF